MYASLGRELEVVSLRNTHVHMHLYARHPHLCGNPSVLQGEPFHNFHKCSLKPIEALKLVKWLWTPPDAKLLGLAWAHCRCNWLWSNNLKSREFNPWMQILVPTPSSQTTLTLHLLTENTPTTKSDWMPKMRCNRHTLSWEVLWTWTHRWREKSRSGGVETDFIWTLFMSREDKILFPIKRQKLEQVKAFNSTHLPNLKDSKPDDLWIDLKNTGCWKRFWLHQNVSFLHLKGLTTYVLKSVSSWEKEQQREDNREEFKKCGRTSSLPSEHRLHCEHE